MPSFDIVSRCDLAEVDNAVNNMTREMSQRYDFKGSNCKIVRDQAVLTLEADNDLKLKQMHELLQGHFARRKIDPDFLDYKAPETAAGQSLRQEVVVRQGIDREAARKIATQVKQAKIKVQVAIQGDELRVTGKKRDDLQTVIALVKDIDLESPLQFVNMRE